MTVAPGVTSLGQDIVVAREGTSMRPVLRSLGTAVLAAAILGPVLPSGAPPAAAAPTEQLVDAVNPFIGTQDNGNTFPGASAPFGMLQVSPDT
ncbi:MAG: hypothetical protein JF622_14980, partial [Terrabacter sp.]|nr:hypothetical protein [Terrabacter sp.]